MKKEIRDMAASVRAKLLQKAKIQGKTFDEIMTLYMLERLLYRLSISQYNDKFVLKGGLLLYILFENVSRTTKDADLLARNIANQLESIGDIFKDICNNPNNDGLIFDTNSLHTLRIKEDADYEGVRVNIACQMGQGKRFCRLT
jgi:predicted nucleotidyltransferase component of viral defense system